MYYATSLPNFDAHWHPRTLARLAQTAEEAGWDGFFIFIPSLQQDDPAAVRLLDLVGSNLVRIISRLVAQEVTRNLATPEQVRRFYHIKFD